MYNIVTQIKLLKLISSHYRMYSITEKTKIIEKRKVYSFVMSISKILQNVCEFILMKTILIIKQTNHKYFKICTIWICAKFNSFTKIYKNFF